MHGLNTIVRLNKTEQDFIDHILSTPVPEVNLLDVWREWKKEKQTNEQLQVHSNR
jgi:hypothetical protein